jgi:hypothetical protein
MLEQSSEHHNSKLFTQAESQCRSLLFIPSLVDVRSVRFGGNDPGDRNWHAWFELLTDTLACHQILRAINHWLCSDWGAAVKHNNSTLQFSPDKKQLSYPKP